MTLDRNILPGMKPTRHSFRCGQPLGPGVAHHGMRNLVHHAQAHVASPRGERLPAQVADHLSDAAYVVVTVEDRRRCHTMGISMVFNLRGEMIA